MFLYSLQYFDNEITKVFHIKVSKVKSIYFQKGIKKKKKKDYIIIEDFCSQILITT